MEELYLLEPKQLEKIEAEYFSHYLKNVYQHTDRKKMNFFEHNLQVWRQFWRVTERSDIICLITDARFPVFHFSLGMFEYMKELKKPIILILNKQDLVARENLKKWIVYFRRNFPGMQVNILFLVFCSLTFLYQ